MKKLFFTAALAATLALAAGCAAILPTSSLMNRVELGMPLKEFRRLMGYVAHLDSMSPRETVYRIDKHNIGTPDYIVGAQYFHFDSAGRLTEIETRHFGPPFFGGHPRFEPLNP